MSDYWADEYDGYRKYCYAKKRVPMTHRWYNTTDKLPEEKRAIIGMDSTGAERNLKFYRNRFWMPDMTMYVYYVPQKWRYA